MPLEVGEKMSLEDCRSHAQAQGDRRPASRRDSCGSNPRHYSVGPDGGKARYACTRQSDRAHRKHSCPGEPPPFHGLDLRKGSARLRADEYMSVESALVCPVIVSPGVLVIAQDGGLLRRHDNAGRLKTGVGVGAVCERQINVRKVDEHA